ncbi:MAG: hypothetical protein Q9213_003948 [Squamulea squamosa]
MNVSHPMDGETNSSEDVADANAASLQAMSSIRYDRFLSYSSRNTLISGDGNEPSPFYMLNYHRDRMLAAADELGWMEARNVLEGRSGDIQLKQVLQAHLTDSYSSAQLSYPLKLRVTINLEGYYSVTSTALPFLPLSTLAFSHFPPVLSQLPPSIDHATFDRSWRIFISPIPVSPSLFTRHKTTERAVYDKARSLIPVTRRRELPHDISSEILIVNRYGEVMEGSITTPYFWRRGRWVTPPTSAGGNIGTTRRFALETGLCVEETVMEESIAGGEAIWLSNGGRGWGWGEIEKLQVDGGPNGSIGTFLHDHA